MNVEYPDISYLRQILLSHHVEKATLLLKNNVFL